MRYTRSYLSKLFADRFGPSVVSMTGDEIWSESKTTVLTLSRAHVFGASAKDIKRENVVCSFSLSLSLIDSIDIPTGNPGDVVLVRFLDGDGAELATVKMKLNVS